MTVPHTLPRCTRHPDTETGLSCTRCGKPYCYQCLSDAPVGKQCVDCVAEGRRTQRRAVNIAGVEDEDRKPLVTPILIAINLIVFVITVIQAGSVQVLGPSVIFDNGILWEQAVAAGQWWRLITHGFLHVALWHVLVNVTSLWLLGQQLEPLFGRLRFGLLYGLSLLGGGVAVFLFSNWVVGASGAVFGLLGALGVVTIRRRQSLQPLMMVLALNVVFGLVIRNVSWVGHAGGLIVGALVAAGLIYVPVATRRLWQTINLVAITVAIAGLAVFHYSELPAYECTPPGQPTACMQVSGD